MDAVLDAAKGKAVKSEPRTIRHASLSMSPDVMRQLFAHDTADDDSDVATGGASGIAGRAPESMVEAVHNSDSDKEKGEADDVVFSASEDCGLSVEDALLRRAPGSWRTCYRLEREPRPLARVVVQSLPAHDAKYIVVVGSSVGMFKMMLRFRLRKIKESLAPVVLVHTVPPSEEQLFLLSWLPDVYFVQGSIISQASLETAGIFDGRASHLIAVSNLSMHDNTNDGGGGVQHQASELADADCICVIRRLYEQHTNNQLRFIIAEFAHGSNMHQLSFNAQDRVLMNNTLAPQRELPPESLWAQLQRWRHRVAGSGAMAEEVNLKGQINLPYHLSQFYASGVALPTGVLHALMASILYNKGALSRCSCRFLRTVYACITHFQLNHMCIHAAHTDIFSIASLLTAGAALSPSQFRETGEVFQWCVPVGLTGW